MHGAIKTLVAELGVLPALLRELKADFLATAPAQAGAIAIRAGALRRGAAQSWAKAEAALGLVGVAAAATSAASDLAEALATLDAADGLPAAVEAGALGGVVRGARQAVPLLNEIGAMTDDHLTYWCGKKNR